MPRSSYQELGDAVAYAGRIAWRYMTSRDWLFAWTALLVLIVIQFGTVYVITWGVRWQQQFYDSLEQRQAALFARLTLIFLGITLGQIGLIVANNLFQQMLGLRWRVFLTERYLGRWMTRDRYYDIDRRQLIDNPDQRISEDIGIVTRNVPSLVMTVLSQITTAITFAFMLMETARTVRFSVMGVGLFLPADLLVYAIAYAVIGMAAVIVIGQPYVARQRRQQAVEGDYRAGLVNVRRNAEQISFAGGHPIEHRSLGRSFAEVQANFRRLILATLGLQTGTSIYTNVGTIIPLFVLVPRFFAGQISLGQIVSGRSAFATFAGSLAFLVNNYSLIGMQVASLLRLRALDDALDAEHPRGIAFAPGCSREGNMAVDIDALRIDRPDGRAVLHVAHWRVSMGERWVIRGSSGAGKSTLLRAIAGLWPDGAGRVTMCDDCRVMFVPQRLYLPMGSLKDAVCFPDRDQAHGDDAIIVLLDQVGLGQHRDHLHEKRLWQEELSPGEQQRVALARILLHRPDVLVLDEATSALDFANARGFYERLLEALPEVTLVSVVHDDRLQRFHTHRLSIDGGVATGGAC
nr:SbmA/BacA-like family transporter [Sphingomonas montana]